MIEREVPMRRCVGCMVSKPKRDLIRLVADGDGVRLDSSGKANGRGVYLCKDAECFAKAKKKRAIGRGLRVELAEPQTEKLFSDLKEVFDIEH